MINVILGLARFYWKELLVATVAVSAIVSFFVWKDNIEDAAYEKGYSTAETEFTKRVNEANRKEQETQTRLDQMTIAFDGLTRQREQAINLTVRPIIEDIQDEIQNNPDYAECVVTSGMLDNLNSGRSAINASIDSSNTAANGS